MKIKLGTHNSMTYLLPEKWYMHPFRFMAKCQAATVEEQYSKYKVRMFDLRVRFSKKKGEPYFCHGLLSFKGDVYSTLKFLNKRGVLVRVVLETSKEDMFQEALFAEFCHRVAKEYRNIKFFGGVRKYDWKTLYDFGFTPEFVDKYSSYNQTKAPITGTYIDDLWPWLYARLNNKKNFADRDKDKYLMVDFVDILKDELERTFNG